MSYMFSGNSYQSQYMDGLVSLDLSAWDTSSLENASNMFAYCRKLTDPQISDWDTSKLNNTSSMFYYDSALNLTALNWTVPLLQSSSSMFYGCTALTTLDLHTWNTGVSLNISNMFRKKITVHIAVFFYIQYNYPKGEMSVC